MIWDDSGLSGYFRMTMEAHAMKWKNLFLLVMIPALLIGPVGCIFSPDDGDGGDDGGGQNDLPYASNPDILIQNFETIYVETRIDDFRDMLHNDYKTVLLPSTLAEWEQGGNPLAEDVFYRDDEIRIHENMFSGNSGLSPVGVVIPPIDSVTVDYIEKAGSWEPIPDGDEHFGGFGGYWALHHVLIYFNKPDQSRYMVEQDVEFYVIPTDDNGRTKWLLLGQRGLEPAI